MKKFLFVLSAFTGSLTFGYAQEQSVARLWNEVLLEAIRNDLARPTIHARNLFHHSAAMYDAWAAYDEDSRTYFLGNTVGDHTFDFKPFRYNGNILEARNEAISYASYRLLLHRFSDSPGASESLALIETLFEELGYDPNVTSSDYSDKSPSKLGNYIAQEIIAFGLSDGSNEVNDYANLFYEPVNGPLVPRSSGIDSVSDPNRWQPLRFEEFIDQSGNLIPGGKPDFLTPEWGDVIPFSLTNESAVEYERDGGVYRVFHDPGPPAYVDTTANTAETDFYRWNHQLVALWSAHLDPSDEEMWEISPASLGNIDPVTFPTSTEEYKLFYELLDGGDPGRGYDVNPFTGEPYATQWVKRADYTRILAEFWADGPDSETPPGHWFTILNYVSDHPELEKRIGGEGPIVDGLEWDIKAYFLLGGAMHDAAISAWSIKGYYDYIRPISALRYMASKGQSTDESLQNFHPAGVELIPGYIEIIEEGDPLQGFLKENVGEIKFKAWRGHRFIPDPNVDIAGVGWILAADWNPYQRQTFVTPPFAGYVSGHSTFSRAAAELLTLMTGNAYFPGGIGVFPAYKDDFLVFENGPSEYVELQWATYRDASDQCSLSRIWGGIHPPIDDIPGRQIGYTVGIEAYHYGAAYFEGKEDIPLTANKVQDRVVYPNPTDDFLHLDLKPGEFSIKSASGKVMRVKLTESSQNGYVFDVRHLRSGLYIIVDNAGAALDKFLKN